ncbi:organic solute transporter subunit alpha/Transmembrane protein, partial [Thamnocephalis sphaerospora]
AHRIGWLMSGLAALTATIISFALIFKHVQYYTVPSQQRYIVRICMMIPIYAFTSWLSYLFYREAPYFEFVRTLYEAFVIACFFILLVHYLGDTSHSQQHALAEAAPDQMKLPLPFCCITYSPSNRNTIWYLKWGILQYAVVQPCLTVTGFIAQFFNRYCPESLSPRYANVYIKAINFISVTVAMYALVTLYVMVKDTLKPHQPFFKFLCVKLVVFFSFWQALVISILSRYDVIKPTQYWTKANIATGLDAILICFEMVAFALLHVKAFDFRVYRPKERHKQTIWGGLVDSLNPMDLVREI